MPVRLALMAQMAHSPGGNSVKKLSRRRILKGMLNGSAVTVALPLLDCFLNDNGTALASGVEMPVRCRSRC